MTINPHKFYQVKEIAELGQEGFFPFKSVTSIYDLISRGKLKAFRGSAAGDKVTVRVQGAELLAFLEAASTMEIQNVDRGRKKEKTKSSKVS